MHPSSITQSNRLRRASGWLAAVAAVLATAAPASALDYVHSGRPGVTTAYQTVGGYDMGVVVLGAGKVLAYRSPASTGTQMVTVRLRVWRTYGGTWAGPDVFSKTYSVLPGQHVAFGGWSAQGLSMYYSTDLKITYRTPAGAFLGSTFYDFVDSGDYVCDTWNGCGVVWIGGQYGLFMF